jgi:hypothetical protein
MKTGLSVCAVMVGMLFLLLFSIAAPAVEHPKEPIAIKLEGAKMPPVTFPHETHVDKAKVACATCHHKDAQNPKACTTCHGAKEAKGGAPLAKDAFHTRCQGCHKESAAKGLSAPTKCNECHKK